MNYNINICIICIFLAMFFVIGACSADSMDSPSAAADFESVPIDFHAQCRDVRCDFLLRGEEGDVEHGVPTWHPFDTGVGLVGEHVEIFTVDEWTGHPRYDVACYEVRLLGVWDDDVDIYLDLKRYPLGEVAPADTDGTEYLPAEYVLTGEEYARTVTVPHGDWDLYTVRIRGAAVRSWMEFTLRKEGVGDAVLYYVEVDGDVTCEGGEIGID